MNGGNIDTIITNVIANIDATIYPFVVKNNLLKFINVQIENSRYPSMKYLIIKPKIIWFFIQVYTLCIKRLYQQIKCIKQIQNNTDPIQINISKKFPIFNSIFIEL